MSPWIQTIKRYTMVAIDLCVHAFRDWGETGCGQARFVLTKMSSVKHEWLFKYFAWRYCAVFDGRVFALVRCR